MTGYAGFTQIIGGKAIKSVSISDMFERTCVLEFSQLSKDRGMYPYHVDTLANSIKHGPQELEWQVIFEGTWAECFEKLHSLPAEKSVFDEDYRVPAPRGDKPVRKPRPAPQVQADTTPSTEYVYFLLGNGLYKIGKTTRQPEERLKDYSPKLPFETELVKVIKTKNCTKLERELHRRFKAKHVRGEWYALTADDLAQL